MSYTSYKKNQINDIIVIGGKNMLKEYRLKNNITLEELAEKTGTSWRNLQRIENGAYKNAKFETIKKIMIALKITDKDIIKFIKEKDQSPSLLTLN